MNNFTFVFMYSSQLLTEWFFDNQIISYCDSNDFMRLFRVYYLRVMCYHGVPRAAFSPITHPFLCLDVSKGLTKPGMMVSSS